MKVRTVTRTSVIFLVLLLELPSEGFHTKKLLAGLVGVKAHAGNVILQNAARVAQFKQQLTENVLEAAVKQARTKADILSVLLSATQALHKPPHAQYGDHNEDVTAMVETPESFTQSPSETTYDPPESENPTPQEAPAPPPPADSPQDASPGVYPPPPPSSPVHVYAPPEQYPPVSTYGIPNDLYVAASNAVSINAPFTDVNVQRPHHHYRHRAVQVNAPFVRLGVNSDGGVNLNVGK